MKTPTTFLLLALFAHGCGHAKAEKLPSPELVRIDGASFIAGTPITNRRDQHYHGDEAPVAVTVPTFLIGKYPVTADQFCLFLNAVDTNSNPVASLYHHEDTIAVGTGRRIKHSSIVFKKGQFMPRQGAAECPANIVTWKGAALFCKWLSQKTGERYRLPSEAEWELAAGGTAKRPWPWGEEEPTAQHGERYNSAFRSRNAWPASPVGSHVANQTPEGVHDMLGYWIGEWCAGEYVAKAEPDDLTNTRMNLGDLQTPRSIRGVWTRSAPAKGITRKLLSLLVWEMSSAQHLGRPWTRWRAHPTDKRSAVYGFRIVKEVESEDENAQHQPAL